jgi:lipopolysaccharide/colanic/teichoic acid biosynthesis glycosyltransferase
LLLFLSLIVRIKLGSPIIFKQKRPGLNEKLFTLYKFRTMNNSKDEHGVLLPDSERLTKFGKFLRATSLDELPSLLNIIKGDLSIVGPRPLLVEYLSLYNDEQKKRHSVRPGLTGLAQVKGRNAISWEEKFHLDLLYMSKISLFYDIMIILLTIKKVIFREGINSSSAATMENFQGTKTN